MYIFTLKCYKYIYLKIYTQAHLFFLSFSSSSTMQRECKHAAQNSDALWWLPRCLKFNRIFFSPNFLTSSSEVLNNHYSFFFACTLRFICRLQTASKVLQFCMSTKLGTGKHYPLLKAQIIRKSM